MLQRGGEVVIRMLENVRQVTIGPLIDQFIEKRTLIYTCLLYTSDAADE